MELRTEMVSQLFSLLPPLERKYVVELGAGIGRFTGELAKQAGQVLAIDFIESVIRKVNFNSNSNSNLIENYFLVYI